VNVEYPDFTQLPDRVREKFQGLPTKVNSFPMLAYSPGTFVEGIDLTNAIFKNLALGDYHKELLVWTVAAHEHATYEMGTANVDVILGEDGLLTAGAGPKSIIVMSTLDPESMNTLGKKVEEESHFRLISAAVSGGHAGATLGDVRSWLIREAAVNCAGAHESDAPSPVERRASPLEP
jgi:hypothetical protein